MLPTRLESTASVRPPPTPRAQFARVVVAAGAAVLLGAGPAVAWDLSTQPPRAPARTGWPQPSPWLAAGKQMKSAAGGIARIYLPKDVPAPPDSADPAGSAASATPGTPGAVPPPVPTVVSIPLHPPHRPYALSLSY